MLRPHHFILLVSLLVDGGTVAPQPDRPRPEAGTSAAPVSPSSWDAGPGAVSAGPSGRDAGTGTAAVNPSGRDAGTVARGLPMVDGRWPDDIQTVATLDGRAVMAAHAAIQELMASMAKEDPRFVGSCDYSPKAMDVIILESRGVYVVQIHARLDRCGRGDSSFSRSAEPEIYVVSPEGRVLAHPYFPYYQ